MGTDNGASRPVWPARSVVGILLVLLSCAPGLPNGEECLKDGDCESGLCRSRTCVPVRLPGGPTVWTSSGGTGGQNGIAGAGGHAAGAGGQATGGQAGSGGPGGLAGAGGQGGT